MRVALIGHGYWGPNLARNFGAIPGVRLARVCERDAERSALAQHLYPWAQVDRDSEASIGAADVDAVAIATPLATHFELARAALLAGKHVMLEKPITATSAQARELIAIAQHERRVLMVDHPFVYGAAVAHLHAMVARGEIGALLHYDSDRANLGPFHGEDDVIWDLAVHDLSILDRLTASQPARVSAIGAGANAARDPQIAHLLLHYDDGLLAHLHLSWLSPVKQRRVTLAGTRALVFYDEVQPDEKLRVYAGAAGADGGPGTPGAGQADALGPNERRSSYRLGDMVSPRLAVHEPLHEVCSHFAACVRDGAQPLTDGAAGLRTVLVLEAAARSLARGGDAVQVEAV
ncbi:MAG: Gfo/Idh/MocA family oxidoreductase [Burkholderiaceae bacterium]|nr:Gfo/Idh/MocA family oxidoreductase [Burkholderiaceae bacterium]